VLEHLLADLGVQLREDLGQRFRVEVRDQLLARVGREEAHQVGHVGRVEGREQLVEPFRVAPVQGVVQLAHELGVQRIVLLERHLLEVFVGFGRESFAVQGVGEVVRFTAHRDLPRLCSDGLARSG
jgi:hypothetical protein